MRNKLFYLVAVVLIKLIPEKKNNNPIIPTTINVVAGASCWMMLMPV